MRSPDEIAMLVAESLNEVASDLRWGTTGEPIRDAVRGEIQKQFVKLANEIERRLREV